MVQQWACACENHTQKGIHFHLALKLFKRRRFAEVRKNLKRKYDIDVDFCEWRSFYYDCYTYISKHDRHHITSENHPPLDNSPLTRNAVNSKRKRYVYANDDLSDAPPLLKRPYKPPRLDLTKFSQIVIANNIKDDDDLCALAGRQVREGKFDLHQFVMARAPVKREELLKTAWKIHGAEQKVKRKNMSRMEILAEALEGEHVDGCTGQWQSAAHEILDRNQINVVAFTHDIRELLQKGRGKGRCLMLCGKSNRGKSFLLR